MSEKLVKIEYGGGSTSGQTVPLPGGGETLVLPGQVVEVTEEVAEALCGEMTKGPPSEASKAELRQLAKSVAGMAATERAKALAKLAEVKPYAKAKRRGPAPFKRVDVSKPKAPKKTKGGEE